jgi:hypothetical protein
VVIGDLDVKSVSLFPTKANSILIVYANAVLTRSISLQTLKTVCRRRSEVTKFFRIVDLNQSAKSNRSNLLEPPHAALLEDRFRVPVVERTDQTNIILRFALTVPRSIRFQVGSGLGAARGENAKGNPRIRESAQ